MDIKKLSASEISMLWAERKGACPEVLAEMKRRIRYSGTLLPVNQAA